MSIHEERFEIGFLDGDFLGDDVLPQQVIHHRLRSPRRRQSANPRQPGSNLHPGMVCRTRAALSLSANLQPHGRFLRAEQFIHAPLGHDASLVEHRDPVTDLLDFVEQVAGEQHDVPFSASERSNWRISRIPAGSSPLVGSSRITKRGRCTSAIASPTRCFMPVENLLTFLRAESVNPTSSMISAMRFLSTPGVRRETSSTLSQAERYGTKAARPAARQHFSARECGWA